MPPPPRCCSPSPPLARTPQLYADASSWGARISIVNAQGSFGPLGDLYTLLTLVVPGLPKSLGGSFAISGPSSGNGFPIALTVAGGGASITFVTCVSSSECKSGYACNMGVCSQWSCPSGTSLSGLLW